MNRIATVLLTIALVLPLAAQQPTPAAAPPQLTATEQVALNTIGKLLTDIDKQKQEMVKTLRAVEADIEKAHPGYKLDEQTGALVKKPEEAKK